MSASAESARAARVALITAEENRRRKRAEQLGLPWPRPYQRPTAGRPSRETHYINALYSQVSKASDLSLVSKTCPPWWMRGKPLVPTAEDFADVVAGIEVKEEEERKNEETDEDEDDNKTEEQDQEKDESHEEGPPKKRLRAPLNTTPLQYKAWFVRFDAIQRKRFSWSTTQTLRCAQQLAPEIFSQVHKDTPRRWPQQIGKEKSRPGPKPKFDEAEIALIVSGCRSLTDKIAVSAPVLAGVATNILQDAGSDKVIRTLLYPKASGQMAGRVVACGPV